MTVSENSGQAVKTLQEKQSKAKKEAEVFAARKKCLSDQIDYSSSLLYLSYKTHVWERKKCEKENPLD